jgi:hypothetical protein
LLQTTISALGITSNLTFSLILLSKSKLRNSFNLLLVALAAFDSTYLVGAILESFRKSFKMASSTHLREEQDSNKFGSGLNERKDYSSLIYTEKYQIVYQIKQI